MFFDFDPSNDSYNNDWEMILKDPDQRVEWGDDYKKRFLHNMDGPKKSKKYSAIISKKKNVAEEKPAPIRQTREKSFHKDPSIIDQSKLSKAQSRKTKEDPNISKMSKANSIKSAAMLSIYSKKF